MKKMMEFLLLKEFDSSMMNKFLLDFTFLYFLFNSGSAQVLSYEFPCLRIYQVAKMEDLFSDKNVILGDFNKYLFLFENHPT